MIADTSNRNGGPKAAVLISVEAPSAVKGRGELQNPERKAVKPVREVAHANS